MLFKNLYNDCAYVGVRPSRFVINGDYLMSQQRAWQYSFVSPYKAYYRTQNGLNVFATAFRFISRISASPSHRSSLGITTSLIVPVRDVRSSFSKSCGYQQ